jgi:hypothetical protein
MDWAGSSNASVCESLDAAVCGNLRSSESTFTATFPFFALRGSAHLRVSSAQLYGFAGQVAMIFGMGGMVLWMELKPKRHMGWKEPQI